MPRLALIMGAMDQVSTQIECVVCMVESISEARERFERLGFTVIDGGLELGTRSRTCLLPFPDGSALQLVERPSGFKARWRRRSLLSRRGTKNLTEKPQKALAYRAVVQCERLHPGPIDFLLRRETFPSVESELNWLSATSEFFGQEEDRHRMDLAIPTRYQRSCPVVRIAGERFPLEDSQLDQRNATQGIYRIQIGVTELETARLIYEQLTGAEPAHHKDEVEERITFPIGKNRIELVPVDIPLEEGVREIELRAGFRGHNVTYDPDGTFGIPLEISDIRDPATTHERSYVPGSVEDSD